MILSNQRAFYNKDLRYQLSNAKSFISIIHAKKANRFVYK